MPDKFPRHEAAVAWAENELGVREHPDGSNTGERVRFYQDRDWLPGTGYPWCAAFVCAVWEEGGKKALPWPSAGAWDMGNRARASGWTVSHPSMLKPGDIVVWAFGAGHVSIFLSYDAKTGAVVTRDGNVRDQVCDNTRPLSQVRDLIHVPELAVKPVPPKTTRPPVFQVVSGDGEGKVIYVSGARAIGKRLARLLARNPAGIVIRRKKP